MEKEVDGKSVEDQSKKIDSPYDAAELMKKIDKIMKTKTNNILILTYHQGIIFQKYRDNKKLLSAVNSCKISKTTINFEIRIIRFIDDYLKMRKSCISLHYLKKNFRIFKEVYKDHGSEFI